MAANPATPLINGEAYAWASIETVILGVNLIGITALSYKDKETFEPIYGKGNKPIAMGAGPIEFEGSLTLLSDEVAALEAASPTGRLQDIPAFNVIFSYQVGTKVLTHRLIACKFMENGRSSSQGDTSIPVELPLFVGDIKWK